MKKLQLYSIPEIIKKIEIICYLVINIIKDKEQKQIFIEIMINMLNYNDKNYSNNTNILIISLKLINDLLMKYSFLIEPVYDITIPKIYNILNLSKNNEEIIQIICYKILLLFNGRCWGRLTTASISTSYSIDNKTFSKDKKEQSDSEKRNYGSADYDDEAEVDEFGNIVATAEEVEERRHEREERRKRDDGEYSYYSVPWSLSGGYTFSYSHPGRQAAVIRQMVNLSGSVTFTDKWRMSMSSGFDIQEGKFATSSLSITRDLHCFSLSFYIIPFGAYKSYNFRLSFGSALFQGLEYKRNQSWRDN